MNKKKKKKYGKIEIYRFGFITKSDIVTKASK